MSFTIPDNDGGQDELLSLLSTKGVEDLSLSGIVTGVVSGMAITGSTSRTITIAAGNYVVNRQLYVYAGGAINLIANTDGSGDPRFDVVEIDTAGSLFKTEGAYAAAPIEPDRALDANSMPTSVKLATILVKNGDDDLVNRISDRRLVSTVVNQLLNDTIDPTGSDGVDGDFWLNTTSNVMWGPKAAGSWSASIDLRPANMSLPANWTQGDGVTGAAPGTMLFKMAI